MATNRQIRELFDATVHDSNGDKLGGVKEVFLNDLTDQPDFVEVNHGLFGMNSSLVPLRGHTLDNDNLVLAFPKDRIKDAPNLDTDAHLSREDQDAIYAHYGLENTENVTNYERDPSQNRNAAGTGTGLGAGAGLGTRDTSNTADYQDYENAPAGTPNATGTDAGLGARDTDRADTYDREPMPNATGPRDSEVEGRRNPDVATEINPGREQGVDSDGNAVIRSEERLNVDKERVNSGEARLRKYVVHDTETVEVPVEREEVHVERTPIDPNSPGAARGRNADLGQDEASVTLHEERVNVTKDSVPVEKVGLEKDVVRDTERVTEDVAKERVDVDEATSRDADIHRDERR